MKKERLTKLGRKLFNNVNEYYLFEKQLIICGVIIIVILDIFALIKYSFWG